jgi:hypothetical protein
MPGALTPEAGAPSGGLGRFDSLPVTWNSVAIAIRLVSRRPSKQSSGQPASGPYGIDNKKMPQKRVLFVSRFTACGWMENTQNPENVTAGNCPIPIDKGRTKRRIRETHFGVLLTKNRFKLAIATS